jgi:branched-chain amino acid transport system substrate-binding protein
MNKKTIIGAIVLLAVIIGGCFLLNKRPATNEPIKIGATLALSGNLAYLGELEKNGLSMAIDEINSTGGINGRKLKLIAEDNQGDAKNAATSIIKLLNVDHADVIFSAFTHVTNAVKNLVAEKKKIMIYASTVKDIAQENELFFRDYYDAENNGKAIAKLVNKNGYKTVKFLTEVSDQCVLYEKAFREEAQKFNITVLQKESYLTTEKDLRTPLLKLKGGKFGAIVVCAWRHEPILMKQLKELGMINIPTFHWVAPFLPAANTSDIRQLFAENKSISTWYGFGEKTSKEKQLQFIKKYTDKYGSKPSPDAAYAYDDVFILANALKNCSSAVLIDSQCIAKALMKTDYSGAGGKLTFDSNRASNREVIAITVIDGLWQEIPID